jgi:hypothetical protein
MRLQLGVATTKCGYNWMRLQLDAAQPGAAQPCATQLGADTTGCGRNWVRIQLGADTTGRSYNRLERMRHKQEFLMFFCREDCLAATKAHLYFYSMYISHFPAVRQRYAMTLQIGKYLSLPVTQK